uniref:Uncharacterized protein n=1 Tax=Anguilla anguilla TaxID=7936 RepID=A0A0E9ULD8_ANGAN
MIFAISWKILLLRSSDHSKAICLLIDPADSFLEEDRRKIERQH